MHRRTLPPLLLVAFLLTLSLTTFSLAQTRLLDRTKIQPATTTAPTGPRTLTMVNQCSFPIWVGAVGGFAKGKACKLPSECGTGRTCKDGACTCSTDADCGVGRGCNPDNKLCYWVLPAPNPGNWKLDPKGQPTATATFTLPEVDYVDNLAHIRWSGAVFPRTGCKTDGANNFVCDTGACGGKTVACAAGHGGTPPATQAEFTFQNYAVDFYDLELINGATVPMEMKPVTPAGGFGTMSGSASYWCGNPGGNPATTPGLGGCEWKFPAYRAMTPIYRYVTASAKICAADSECAADERCGLSIAAIAPQFLGPNLPPYWGKLTCGRPLGYWSPIGICGLNPNFGPQPKLGMPTTNLYDCNLPVDPQFGTYRTLSNLYGCVVPRPAGIRDPMISRKIQPSATVTPPGPTPPPPCKVTDPLCPAESCYAKGASATCCGCAPWPWPTNDIACQNDNPAFELYYFQKIEFLKFACPTSYTYQYDDETSTFHCMSKFDQAKSQANAVSYTITFCPGGLEGGVGH